MAQKFNLQRRKPLSPMAKSIVRSAGLDAAVSGIKVPTFGVQLSNLSNDEYQLLSDDDINGDEDEILWKKPSYGELM